MPVNTAQCRSMLINAGSILLDLALFGIDRHWSELIRIDWHWDQCQNFDRHWSVLGIDRGSPVYINCIHWLILLNHGVNLSRALTPYPILKCVAYTIFHYAESHQKKQIFVYPKDRKPSIWNPSIFMILLNEYSCQQTPKQADFNFARTWSTGRAPIGGVL